MSRERGGGGERERGKGRERVCLLALPSSGPFSDSIGVRFDKRMEETGEEGKGGRERKSPPFAFIPSFAQDRRRTRGGKKGMKREKNPLPGSSLSLILISNWSEEKETGEGEGEEGRKGSNFTGASDFFESRREKRGRGRGDCAFFSL